MRTLVCTNANGTAGLASMSMVAPAPAIWRTLARAPYLPCDAHPGMHALPSQPHTPGMHSGMTAVPCPPRPASVNGSKFGRVALLSGEGRETVYA